MLKNGSPLKIFTQSNLTFFEVCLGSQTPNPHKPLNLRYGRYLRNDHTNHVFKQDISLHANMVKWTTFDPCTSVIKNYIQTLSFVRRKDLESIFLYKAKQLLLTNTIYTKKNLHI